MEIPEEKTHLSQWGNSKATRIPKRIVEALGLKLNQTLKVKIEKGSIVLTPEEEEPKNIHELFSNWQDDGQRDHELDWGQAQGHEMLW